MALWFRAVCTFSTSLPHHRYWMGFCMIATYLAGFAFALGIHIHYSMRNGNVVGPFFRQQFALFVGTALAYLSSVSLAFGVRIVATQYLWWELKKQEISVTGINAAFSTASDPTAFANEEVRKQTTKSAMFAVVAWFIPISAFIAPTTLNVQTKMLDRNMFMQIPTLEIGDPDQFQRYSYTINDTSGNQKFLGPRTIVSRISLAVATTGAILTLPQPATNATYNQTFYGPYVQCSNSSQVVRTSVDDMARRFTAAHRTTSADLVMLDYFAAIPALSNRADISQPVQAANLSDVDGALYASNQLWILLRDYEPSLNFSTSVRTRYLTCELFNASYETNFTWQNGLQEVEIRRLTVLNQVSYPSISTSPTPESQVYKSYSAVMSSLASQLVGSSAFFKDLSSSTRRIYSSIRTDIAQTVLLGSSDFNAHFLTNHLLGLGYGDSGLPSSDGNSSASLGFSDQRLQDMAYVNARRLDELIPELSKNITISLLTDSLLAPSTQIDVLVHTPATVYAYQSLPIVIIYVIALSVCLVITAAGAWIILGTGRCHDTSWISVVCSTQSLKFMGLLPHERCGVLPQSQEIKETQLKFCDGSTAKYGFHIVVADPGLNPNIHSDIGMDNKDT